MEWRATRIGVGRVMADPHVQPVPPRGGAKILAAESRICSLTAQLRDQKKFELRFALAPLPPSTSLFSLPFFLLPPRLYLLQPAVRFVAPLFSSFFE